MKITLERTQFEPNYREGVPVSWNVAFTITTDSGLELYTPTLVEYREVTPPVTEAAVTIRAWQEVVPGQLWHLYKEVNNLTEMDQLAASIHEEEVNLAVEQNNFKALQEQSEQSVNAAKTRLERAQTARKALNEKMEAQKRARAEGKLTFGGSTTNGDDASNNK